jgi:hypothetical protein
VRTSPTEGGVDAVGAEDYLRRGAATDLPSAQLKLPITRQNLDRHPNYILAAYMASGT